MRQLLAEMASMRVDKMLYLSWTEESSTVFKYVIHCVNILNLFISV